MPGIHDVMQGLQWHVLKEWDISQSADKALEINNLSFPRSDLPVSNRMVIRCVYTPLVFMLKGCKLVIWHALALDNEE
jgi:hypothetical protein